MTSNETLNMNTDVEEKTMNASNKAHMMFDPDDLLTTRQAAQLLSLSPRTLEGYRTRGAPDPGLDFVKFGQAVRYRRKDVISYRDARLRSSTSDAGD